MQVVNLEGARGEIAKSLGLTFAPSQRRLSFHNKSWIEPPIFCVAGLHASTKVGIGGFTLLNGGSIAHAEIGRYCSLANHVAIGFAEHPIDRFTSSNLTFSHNFQGWRSYMEEHGRKANLETAKFDDRPPTTIGNDVWIGQGAFLKAGVTIGDGAIVAAHAVVVKDVEPYTIVAGVPAKPVRKRFPQELIARLQALRWWDYCVVEFGGIDVENAEKSVEWMEKHLSDLEPLPSNKMSAEQINDKIDDALANAPE